MIDSVEKSSMVIGNTSWMEYQGKKILFDDFGDAQEEELLTCIPKIAEYILENNLENVLRLTNVRNCSSSTKVVDISKVSTSKIKSNVSKSAVYGATTLQRVLVMFVSNFVKIDIAMFKTKQEALDYLVADD